MKNPIVNCGLFHTPESMEKLQEYASQFKGGDGATVMTILGLTWNLASKVVDEALAQDDQPAAIILTTKLPAYSQGEALGVDYRGVIKDGLLIIQQPIRGEWYPALGGWSIETILEHHGDRIALDFGQGWFVGNFLELITEIKGLLLKKGLEALS